MADEHPRDDAGPGDQRAPDEPTQPEPRPGRDASQAEPGDEPTEPGPDETARQPSGAGDENVVSGPAGPSGTAVMPAVPEPSKWTARAAVPPAKPDDGGWDETSWQRPGWDQPASAWQEDGPSRPQRALAPILITLLVLVLLAILVFGIWLVVRAQNDETPAPSDTGAPSATAGTTAPPTTPPPTTPAPPPSTAPQPVLIPDVSGQDYQSASASLRALGLQVTRADRPSMSVPAGRVIGTDPAIGAQLLPGATVAIIVSSGPPTPPPVQTPSPTVSGG